MIDTHAHYYGEALFAALATRDAVPRVETTGQTRWMLTPTSRFALRGGFVDLGTRLAWMQAQGITHQVITFPGALGPDVLPAIEAVPLVRDVNDELSAVCALHPERFTALAGLPLADPDAAVAELERACTTLGLRGAIIPSNYFDSLATMAHIRPLLDAAASLGAHVMVHPGQRHDQALAPHRYDDLAIHRASTIDLHNGLSHAVTTLTHAELPDGLSVQVVNLGGAFPILVERMDHVVRMRDPSAPLPSSLLGGLVFDTASLGPRAIEIGVAVFGADHVMLGSDYPIFDSPTAREALSAARISGEARLAVAEGTARHVLGRPVPRHGDCTAP